MTNSSDYQGNEHKLQLNPFDVIAMCCPGWLQQPLGIFSPEVLLLPDFPLNTSQSLFQSECPFAWFHVIDEKSTPDIEDFISKLIGFPTNLVF